MSDGIYSNRVSLSQEMKIKAEELTIECSDALCQTQRLLDYVSNIPYSTNRFQAHTPKKTMELRYGDCDDKSNLLISLLYAVNIKAYFVLVHKHIFVIVELDDKRLKDTKALWLDGKPYYILESTAEKSLVGYHLKYRLDQIEMILDPFINKEVDVAKLEWR